MKILLETYSFNAAAKQITFITSDTVTLERLLLITNVTTNTIIYNFADPNTGGSVSNNVLTLDYNTAAMSDSDKLQIFLDSGKAPASDEMLQELEDHTILLRRMVKLLEPSAVQDAAQRQRVAVDAFTPTIPAVTTVSTVTNLAQLAGIPSNEHLLVMARNAYANAIRNKITFS